jgi:arylsulfatase A-like enzyme
MLASLLLLAGSAAGCTGGTASASDPRPNIVFVLTDDLSMNLVPYMPHVQALERSGTTFDNYTVTDSLCCPSRSSILSGRFPHDTGVYTNGGDDGGFNTFHSRGEESSTFATSLRSAGYRTAMMGKYLNGYEPKSGYVPPGWTEWDVAGNGYPEFNYNLNEDHKLTHYGKAPTDYLTDVLGGKASSFISSSVSAHTPFMVEVATFAPHAPYTPAPRDGNAFPGLTAPRGPAFDTLPDDPPPWLATRTPLTPNETAAIDTDFRKRVQAVQAVDRMVGALESTVDKAGVAKKTIVVFSSDNGYHLGEYRLNPGKMTAFDTDIHVPLVVSGPGVAAGHTVEQPVENIDLRPTFEELGRATTPSNVDGRSLVPLLGGGSPSGWRTAGLVEHHGADHDASDPDLPAPGSGNPTTYEAIRTATYTYVEYNDGTREYYDRTTDPDELHNTVAKLPAGTLDHLHTALRALTDCHGSGACWDAGHI